MSAHGEDREAQVRQTGDSVNQYYVITQGSWLELVATLTASLLLLVLVFLACILLHRVYDHSALCRRCHTE